MSTVGDAMAPTTGAQDEMRARIGRQGRTRALFVFGSLERAGAQLRTLEVCAELQHDGLDFALCSIGLGPNELGQEIARLGGSSNVVSMRSPRFPFAFSRMLREGSFDVVNTEPQLLSGIVVWLAALHRVPMRIVTIHNTMGQPGQGASSPIVRRVLASRPFVAAMRLLMTRSATHVVAVSRCALDSVLPGRWRSTCDHRVIYNGTTESVFQGPVDGDGVRAEFGWPADARVVVNVGRFTEQKNHRGMLEAMRLVRAREPRARLLLIGSGVLRPEIEGTIDDLELRDVCAITSDRTDVPRLLLASDVFFFPSAWEGLPGAPLEALASGLRLVTSDIPSMREIEPWFPGAILMAPATAAERHAEHIVRTLANPHDRNEARRRFEATPFTFDHAVQAYRALYGITGDGHGA
jgi:glycosyltransferase involved in cell wall biosynthesis